MSNPFDQFDPAPQPEPVNPYAQFYQSVRAPAALSMIPSGLQVTVPAPAKEPNPFDQFDPPAPTAPAAPGAAAGPNPFDQFDMPPPAAAQPQLDAAGDVGGGIVSGLVNGVTNFAGLPGTLQQLEGRLAGKGLDAMGFPGAAETVRNAPFLPTGETLTGLAAKVMGPLYRKPETVPGQYAQSIAENVPGAMIGPGGLVRKIMEAVVPGVASETAGRVAPAGYEGAARVAGGLAGNLGTAAGAARVNAGDRAVVAATRGVDPETLRTGQPVIDTGRGIGVDLSGPEGIQAATNNGTKLGDLQRVVEGSVAGGPTMAQFYANRPQQMRAAADNAFDTIAPQAADPYSLGPRVGAAADTTIDGVRQAINRQTRPDYAAAEAHVMDPADFAPMQTPAFNASLQRLRADPVLGPEIAQLPDNSGRVIDLVTRDMGARSAALGASGEGFNPLLSERYAAGAAETRDILRDPARGGVQAYDDALTAQAQARTQNLDPLTQGPVGALARVGESGAGVHNGTQAAGQVILPSTPLRGGETQLADATRRVGAIDPEAIAQLVRQRMADQYEHSATGLVGGPAQGGGAKFAKDMAGDAASQKQANIDAVLGALPNSPQAPQAVNTLLDTLRATGARRPPGSNTAMDRVMTETLSDQGSLGEAVTALRTQGRSLLSNAGSAAKRVALGRATGRLADLFVHPNSANMIADIAKRGVEPVFANAMLRQALQAPGAVSHR